MRCHLKDVEPGGQARSQYRLPFGMYRGLRLCDVPADYLIWLGDEASSPSLRLLARKQLGLLEEDEDNTEPSPELASVKFPLLVWEWCQVMRREYATDPAGRVVVDRGFRELRRLCTSLTGKVWPEDAEGGAAA